MGMMRYETDACCHWLLSCGVKNDYLSNWYPAPFYLDGVQFENTEQYRMYHKAVQFGDSEIAMQILQSGAPDEVKRLGRQVHGYVDKVWAGIR